MTVPYEEIENRLAICCEFLINRKKPIEKAYESLMEKLGTKLLKYSEFEYWFKRFQNNQFDLGYDTSQDTVIGIQNTMDPEASEAEEVPAVIIVDQVEVVQKETQYLRSDLRFNVENVPGVFRILTLVRGVLYKLKVVNVDICDHYCAMKFNKVEVRMEKVNNNWMIAYKKKEVIKTDDVEKSIVDHLWFLLKNQKQKVGCINLKIETTSSMDLERLNLLLRSMLDSIDHQIPTAQLNIKGLNEDTLFSLLNRIQPGTLTRIGFDIAWKEEGNYRKIREIVEMDQWKKASFICTDEVTLLNINNLLHCTGYKFQYRYC